MSKCLALQAKCHRPTPGAPSGSAWWRVSCASPRLLSTIRRVELASDSGGQGRFGEAAEGHGRVREDISRGVVQLLKEYGGKGPTKARTYIEENLVLVVMQGGFTRAEQTLFEDGKWQDVRAMRHAFSDTMEGRLTELIDQAMGRQVLAFLSASHQDPDVQIEAFLLDGPSGAEPPSG